MCYLKLYCHTKLRYLCRVHFHPDNSTFSVYFLFLRDHLHSNNFASLLAAVSLYNSMVQRAAAMLSFVKSLWTLILAANHGRADISNYGAAESIP